ncbi:energy transducer TonB [Pseudidiomarina sp. 1APP75-32.1]|uniref:Protein TonB n=1 Tax=Pseudidiomarina terrestris TaxID=2820060 RepID=A0AAW7R303_9GAMM|nr:MULTISPECIES: energy transducer TonB [unclassified Pseudidiomarina]MDN7125131.1 energy transducer TonB [Pseudidiomarina sp. 1APP75-32.1]MDN7127466.1 energy transducer TonB [Pseudidiomarina sp. 1APR75-33.1]MDN7129892.1 energy transducer TonB [Pseudidiomarina sp. 1APR75-15]MDN7138417.1 energy transducer TonB [Pseudidiomarina sp. 1ASP75-14]MEA3589003.1 energy transducer TonB [Pseudidiomarina sp. 1APP75-27a]
MRFLAALAVAAIVTLGLFYLMQSLITGGQGAMTEPAKGSVLDFVRIKPEEVVQQKERKPERPPEPEAPPPDMPTPQMDTSELSPDGGSYDFSTSAQADTGLSGGMNLDTSDGEYLPIVKVQAAYPRRALQRGIEGYVVVEFTVTRQGTVRDPRVVEAQPEQIFDQAAMDAVLKFKYKPRVVNGDAVEVEGVQNRITFEIDG